jgi:hypothetical protein
VCQMGIAESVSASPLIAGDGIRVLSIHPAIFVPCVSSRICYFLYWRDATELNMPPSHRLDLAQCRLFTWQVTQILIMLILVGVHGR